MGETGSTRLISEMGNSHGIDVVDRPRQLLARATGAAKQLNSVVEQTNSFKLISGRKHLFIEAWETIGAFFGSTAGIEWTRELKTSEGKVIGYEARAFVRRNGADISMAEAMCSREEANWKDRDLYALRSMAQTRACSKALRLVFSWVAVLGGYQPTPAEEIVENGEYLVEDKATQVEDKATQIVLWLMEMHGNDKDKSQAQLEELTSFIGKDGKKVPGVRTSKDLKAFRSMRLRIAYFKVKELYEAWKGEQITATPDVPY